jgi:hypothetical protein
MLGAVVFVGAVALETTAEGAEVAWADPSAFVAVTVTWSVSPTSSCVALYVALAAPEIAEQEPAESHLVQA